MKWVSPASLSFTAQIVLPPLQFEFLTVFQHMASGCFISETFHSNITYCENTFVLQLKHSYISLRNYFM